MTQRFTTTDVLRLELEAEPAPGAVVNLIANPNGELGGWGWITPVAGSHMQTMFIPGTTTRLLSWHSAVNGGGVPQQFYSEAGPVTPGQWVAIRWHVYSSGGRIQAHVQWLDAAGAVVGSTALSTGVNNGGVRTVAAQQVPAGVVAARARFVHDNGVNNGDPAGLVYNFYEVVLARANTAAALAVVGYIDPVPYVDILGPSVELRLVRSELDLGLVEATIRDTTLDPSQSDAIRPDRRIRLRATADAGASYIQMAAAKARNASVTYADKGRRAGDRKAARIELAGVDNVARLAQETRPETVATIDDLPYVLEGCGIPWNVNGSGNQVPAAVVTATNENASAVDQLAISRDSALGFAWVDRYGIVQAWDRDLLAPASHTLEAADYVAADVDYDTDRTINEVRVNFLRHNPQTGHTEEVPYGPYRDQASVDEWGLHAKTFTITAALEDPAAIEDYAAAILAANATPAVRVNSVTLVLKTLDDVARFAGLDLYDDVTVNGLPAGNFTGLRITRLEHAITARRWRVTVGLASSDGVAPPTAVPAPPSNAGGKTMAELLRPVGEVTMFYGLPQNVWPGWRVLNGSAVGNEPELVEWLELNGLPTANLPNLTDKIPVGAGVKAVGDSSGSWAKTLTVAQLPSHDHGGGSLTAGAAGSGHQHAITRKTGVGTSTGFARGNATADTDGNTVGGDGTHTHNVTGLTGTRGNGDPVDITPPVVALYFVIRSRAGAPAGV